MSRSRFLSYFARTFFRTQSSNFAVDVRITPRAGILDPVGETLGRALADLGYDGVGRVHAGRLISFQLEADDAETARASVVQMCEKLIANPVIEDYAIRVEPAVTEAGVA